MSRDTFSDAQAADVLGRAARMQAAIDTARRGVLTLDDLKEAGAAAGIDPAFVEAAARAALPESPPPAPYLGVPLGVQRVRYAEGTLDAAAWARIVADLRRTLGGKGQVEAANGVFAWHRAPLHITAETVGGVTRLVATGAWGGEARSLLTIAGVMLGTAVVMLAAGLLDADGTLLRLAVLYTMLAAIGGGIVWPRFRKKETRVGAKFDAALDRIEATIEAASMPALSRSAPLSAPRLALPDDEAPAGASAVNGRTRERA